MAEKFLSEGWMQLYKEAWNKDAGLMKSLSALSGLLEVGISGSDIPHMQIALRQGKVHGIGQKQERDGDFILEAKPELWEKVANGKQGVKTAIMTKKIKFKGPFTVAMQFIGGMTNALLLFGKIDTDWHV